MSAKYFTPFEVYKRYVAIKAHFDCNNSYDFIKYQGKMRLKEESFRRRKDSAFFYRLSRKIPAKEINYFFIANFSVQNFPWIGYLLDPSSEKIYHNWLNRIENLESHFSQQFSRVLSQSQKQKDSELLIAENSTTPTILSYYENGEISLETLFILDYCLSLFSRNREKDSSQILDFTNFPNIECKCSQYGKFLNFSSEDKNKYIEIISEKIRG